MKHIKVFENFDIEKFMENPDQFFHDDFNEEIEEGDYITCYRGTGQVLELGKIFANIQLMDGPKTIVKVPLENLTKLTREQAMEIMQKSGNYQADLKDIYNSLEKYLNAIETTSEVGDEQISGNLGATVNYLEEILTDIISLKRKDPFITMYHDFSNLVNLVARLSHYAMEQSENDPKLQDRIIGVLDKFYEISE